ncbi:MAG: hypothetical protein ACJ75B_10570 [Flavisolibacter sp.]
MSAYKLIKDPLQHHILLDDGLARPADLYQFSNFLDQAEDVIVHPGYMIDGGESGIFYFKRVGDNTNILLEARLKDEMMVVQRMIVNPSIEYISNLLKTGSLIRFSTSQPR